MSRALTTNELQNLERAWLLGTQRSPAPVPDRLAVADGQGEADPAGLVALAWRAQQRQLTALAPSSREAPTWIEAPADPRPSFPDALRPALARLVLAAEARSQLEVLRPVAWWMRDAGYRLHPFDTFAMGHASFDACIGDYEAWLGEQVGVPVVHQDWVPDADDTTWERYGPATRQHWLEAVRKNDPHKAREVLQGVWSRERAEVRLRLLQALAVRPVPEDREFLQSLSKDRSGKVRKLAAGLLARVPGSAEHDDIKKTLRELLRVKRRPGGLRIQIASGADLGLVLQQVSNVHPQALADELNVERSVLFVGSDAEMLAPAFAVGALRHGDEGLMEQFADGLGKGRTAVSVWVDLFEGIPPQVMRPFARRVLVGKAAVGLVEKPDDAEIWGELLASPLSDEGARAVLESAPYRKVVGALLGDDGMDIAKALVHVAILIPPSSARAAAATLEAAGAMAAPLVQALWRLLADLHEVTGDPTASSG